GQGPPAYLPDLLRGFLETAGVEIGQQQVRTGLGQRQGHGPPHPPGRARDHRDTSGQVEELSSHRTILRAKGQACRRQTGGDYATPVRTPFTTLGNGSPRIALATVPATVSRSLRAAFTLAEALCGMITTLGIRSIG